MLLPRAAVKVFVACGLVVALLVAQTLGLVHGVTHSGVFESAHAHSLASDEAPPHGPSHVHHAGHSHGVFELLFSDHDGEKDCRLYDQASCGGMAPLSAMLLLPVVPPPFEVAIFQGEALARWAALFDARGPPLTV